MINWIKKTWKKLLLTLGVFSIAVGAMAYSPIPQHELLKTDKANIIASRLHEGAVQYAYRDLNKEILLEENEYKRTPYSRSFKMKQRETDGILYNVKVTKIISGLPQYYPAPNGKWFQIDYGTTTPKSFNKQISYVPKSFLWETAHAAQTSLFSSSTDGYVGELTNAAWTTMIDDVGDTNGATATESGVGLARIGSAVGCSGSGTWDILTKGVFSYNTPVIGSGETAVSSTIVFNTNSDAHADNYSQAIEVVEKSNTGNPLQSSDYAKAGFGSVSFGSTTVASLISANLRFGILLNQAGIDLLTQQIQAATSTTFSTMMTAQLTEIEPSCGSDLSAAVGVYFSEQAGTSQDPELHIEHQSPAVAGITVPPIIIHYD